MSTLSESYDLITNLFDRLTQARNARNVRRRALYDQYVQPAVDALRLIHQDYLTKLAELDARLPDDGPPAREPDLRQTVIQIHQAATNPVEHKYQSHELEQFLETARIGFAFERAQILSRAIPVYAGDSEGWVSATHELESRLGDYFSVAASEGREPQELLTRLGSPYRSTLVLLRTGASGATIRRRLAHVRRHLDDCLHRVLSAASQVEALTNKP